CYQGLKLPGWLTDLRNLVLVELDRCKRCSHLPPLGELPLLRFLKIREMDVVECISSEFYGNGVNPFSSLEGLDIDSMPVLETSKTVNKRVNFPRLRILTFKKCPKKNASFLSRRDIGSIEIHDLSSVTNFLIGLLQNQTHLEELTIASLPELKSLLNKLDNLSMVKHLNFNDCKKLEDIPEALQKCFREFDFEWLQQSFFRFPELCLVDCPMLDSLPGEIQCLSALRMLPISWCNRLTSVPNQIEHLTSLFELKQESCTKLLGFQLSLLENIYKNIL
ncbi:hypothetical protein ES288_A01G029900v1, partial [Gossypium darwinii]